MARRAIAIGSERHAGVAECQDPLPVEWIETSDAGCQASQRERNCATNGITAADRPGPDGGPGHHRRECPEVPAARLEPLYAKPRPLEQVPQAMRRVTP